MEHIQTFPGKDVLAPSLTMGAASLNVRDIELLQKFYIEVIGLEVIEKEDRKLILGFRETPIVILHATPNLPLPPPASAGLYHAAILFSSRGRLARTVERILTDASDLYTGSGDHLVSESFYLSDPEGNGIELYFDRDPSVWEWENGLVKMATLYIPEHDYVRQHSSIKEQGVMGIGHVHLKVGDINEARRFYMDMVGFNMTATLPSALFTSVGGYHHHLGMNMWESGGAGKREQTLGLRSFGLILPTQNDLERLKERVIRNDVEEIGGGFSFADPWNNRIIALVH
jgi:catechol 2,3-dioxygenase